MRFRCPRQFRAPDQYWETRVQGIPPSFAYIARLILFKYVVDLLATNRFDLKELNGDALRHYPGFGRVVRVRGVRQVPVLLADHSHDKIGLFLDRL